MKNIYVVGKDEVDLELVQEYLKHMDLLNDLANWTQFANYDMLPSLIKLRTLVNKLQPHTDTETILYRGMGLDIKYQNNLSLKPDDKYKNSNFKFKVLLDKPISFSTNEEIATDFGSSVIEIKPGKLIPNFLRITPEISWALASRNKVTATSEREWIWIPDKIVTIEARFIKYKKPLLPSWVF